ncbi:hypothetical protein MPDQ_008109 [Monascus purpureus]|uniref:Acyltransferase 3 domain-containing protein n=1 Tax=Monascus purpureus TaxID=5098 RepID=A0A507QSZ2_MONPU|nr:hypothetical protein MPDQ_008109 [Monascus purpureus]BDD62196.1 hypothetical protein MAP00_007177 [Monascus purpureus]
MIVKDLPESREVWLDGLRGIAAAVVAWFHFTVDVMQVPYRQYGDDPPENNRYWYQLAPFRVLFAGQAMVRVFFVISGYSVAISIIRHRDRENNNARFYHKLSSSVLRRVFRLYLPVVVLCVFSQTLYYTGFYHWEFFPPEGCPGAEPWSFVWPHFRCAALALLSSLSLATGPWFSGGLNGQLWSMADEIKGSLAVYLVILCLASVAPRARVALTTFIGFLLLWTGFPHLSAFIAGLLYAELDLLKRKQQQQPYGGMPTINSLKAPAPVPKIWHQPAMLALFMFGIYFFCLPVLEDFPVDYWFPVPFDPVPFWIGPYVRINAWHVVGAVIVVGTLRHLPFLRKAVLEAPLSQFLGKISFSFYLFHQSFIRTMRNPIQHSVCQALSGKDLYQTRDDPEGSAVYYLSWIVAAAMILPPVILTSMYVTKVVDRQSVVLSYNVEKRLTGR